MKPDWKDAPDWAGWRIMDDCRTWWWCEEKPKPANPPFSMKIDFGHGRFERAVAFLQGQPEKRPDSEHGFSRAEQAVWDEMHGR